MVWNPNALAQNAQPLNTSLSFAGLLSFYHLFPLCRSTLAHETCRMVSFLGSSDTRVYTVFFLEYLPYHRLVPSPEALLWCIIRSHPAWFVGRFCCISPTQLWAQRGWAPSTVVYVVKAQKMRVRFTADPE